MTPDQVIHGDCAQLLRGLPSESVETVITDPPYGVRYRDRGGRSIANDDDPACILTAFTRIYRVLKPELPLRLLLRLESRRCVLSRVDAGWLSVGRASCLGKILCIQHALPRGAARTGVATC